MSKLKKKLSLSLSTYHQSMENMKRFCNFEHKRNAIWEDSMIKINDVITLPKLPEMNLRPCSIYPGSTKSAKFLWYDFWKRWMLAIRGSCLEINACITKYEEIMIMTTREITLGLIFVFITEKPFICSNFRKTIGGKESLE